MLTSPGCIKRLIDLSLAEQRSSAVNRRIRMILAQTGFGKLRAAEQISPVTGWNSIILCYPLIEDLRLRREEHSRQRQGAIGSLFRPGKNKGASKQGLISS
jgi:hypothetical protein